VNKWNFTSLVLKVASIEITLSSPNETMAYNWNGVCIPIVNGTWIPLSSLAFGIGHHTKYGQSDFGFLAFLHFLVRVPSYKCSIPSGSLHGFVHRLEILKFVHVGCMRINLDCMCPSMSNFFFPHQVHVVKGWFLWVLNLNILRFWNTTHVWIYALS
jgi:hypothetical protein